MCWMRRVTDDGYDTHMQGYDRKPEELRSQWRSRLILEDDIEMEFKILGWECLD